MTRKKFFTPLFCCWKTIARICKPLKEARNRFPAWRNRFLGSLIAYKYGLKVQKARPATVPCDDNGGECAAEDLHTCSEFNM